MTNREEVAEKLRRIEEDVDYETAFMEIDTIIGTKDNYSFSFFFNRLADLIDPTCHMSWEYGNGDDDTEEYMEEIAGTHEDTVACHCHECDEVFRYDRGIIPNYCPNCGARVMRDEA
jgi:hypothetical protein|nr:MAG TPA: DNA-directed RNA polymerase [Caudoviricetes sp.]